MLERNGTTFSVKTAFCVFLQKLKPQRQALQLQLRLYQHKLTMTSLKTSLKVWGILMMVS